SDLKPEDPRLKNKTTASAFAEKMKPEERRAFFDQVSAMATKDPEAQKSKQKAISKIAGCFNENAWCHQSTLEDYAKDPKKDIGNVYQDTREYIFNALQKARRAPLNSMGQAITNWDFNKGIDQKATESKPFENYQKQVTDTQKA